MKLQNKVAIITGGGTGIGRAIAETFAREGAKVIVAGRRLEKIRETVDTITSAGGSAVAVQADVQNHDDNQKLVDETIRAFGKLNILVNNAGDFIVGNVTETSVEDWDRIFGVNVRGAFLLSRLALPVIESGGSGSIINISSTLGQQVIPACAAYCSSKAALNMMSQSMSLDYATKGIRVNTISPGIVDTPIHSARKIEDVAAWEKQAAAMHPLGRMGKPIDVATAALFLASDEASWITGVNLEVDGGIHLS